MYTKEEFAAFPDHTTPEIARSCLDQTLLTAHVAGIADPATLSWLETPPEAELKRSTRAITARALVDTEGDLTEEGLELYRLAQNVSRHLDRYDYNSTNRALDVATLLVLADRFGCLIEAATALVLAPRMGESLYWKDDGLLLWDRHWDLASKERVLQVHQALRAGCSDDLDFAAKLYALAEVDVETRARHFLNERTFSLMFQAREGLLEAFLSGRSTVEERPINFRLMARLRLLFPIAWPDRLCAIQAGDPHRFKLDGADSSGLVSRHCAGAWSKGNWAVVAIMDRGEYFVDGTFRDAPVANFLCRVDSQIPPREIACLAQMMAAQRNDSRIDENTRRIFAEQEIPIGSRVRVTALGGETKIEEVVEFGGAFNPQTADAALVEEARLDQEDELGAPDLYAHERSSEDVNSSTRRSMVRRHDVSGHPRWSASDEVALPRRALRRSGSRIDSAAFVVGWQPDPGGPIPIIAGDLPTPLSAKPCEDIPASGPFWVRVVSGICEGDSNRLIGFVLESRSGRTFPLPITALSIFPVHPELKALISKQIEMISFGLDTDGHPFLSRVPLLEADREALLNQGISRGVVSRFSKDRNGVDWVHVSISRDPDIFHDVRLRLAKVPANRRGYLKEGVEVLLSVQRSAFKDSGWMVSEPKVEVSPTERERLREAGIECTAQQLRCRTAPSFDSIVKLQRSLPNLRSVLRRLFEVTHSLHGRLHEVGPTLEVYDRLRQRALALRESALTADARQTKAALIDLQTQLEASDLSSAARQEVTSICDAAWELRSIARVEQWIAHLEAENKKLQGWISQGTGTERHRQFVQENEAKLAAARAELRQLNLRGLR